MNEGIGRIESFIAGAKNSQQTSQSQKQSDKSNKVDLSMLPDGVSKFEIDGDKITIWKKGDRIQTQVVGMNHTPIDEVHEKVKKYLENNQNAN